MSMREIITNTTTLAEEGRKKKVKKKIENRANPTTSTPSPIDIWNGPALLHGHISSRFDFSLDKEHK